MDATMRYGFLRVGAAVPQLKVADPAYNMERIYEILQEADQKKISVLVFPELCLTGYTCNDLFDQRFLRSKALDTLAHLLQKTVDNQVLAVIGLPLELHEGLYNCAVLLQNGNILGIVPKMYLPDFGEYQESRWFLSGLEISKAQQHVTVLGRPVPFGHLLFSAPTYCLGVEICEDMWLPIPPGVVLALHGANLIVNPMAGNEGGSKAENRLKMAQRQSSRCQSGYVIASAGVGESTTDLVFGGHAIISENGVLLEDGQNSRFQRQNTLVFTEIDIEGLIQTRLRNKSFARQKGLTFHNETYINIPVKGRSDGPWQEEDFSSSRSIDQRPFEPGTAVALNCFCQEILEIQKAALAGRLESKGQKQVLIDIQGDLNSTLALIVAATTMPLLNQPASAVTGMYLADSKSDENHKLQEKLQQLTACIGASFDTVSIQSLSVEHDDVLNTLLQKPPANLCDQQIADIKRIRAQLLLNAAQQKNALLLGSANMSQLALGLSVLGGDLTAEYQINTGLPMTVVQRMVAWSLKTLYKGNNAKTLINILNDACCTELQLEDNQGPYQVYDFYLYYTLKFGTQPAKLLFLAKQAFGQVYDTASLQQWLQTFYKRFFTFQAQRSQAADGPKALGLSLSPRIGLHIPSDAQGRLWWKELPDSSGDSSDNKTDDSSKSINPA